MTILSNTIRNYIVHFRLIATKNSFKLPVSFTEKASSLQSNLFSLSSPAGKCKTERERDKKNLLTGSKDMVTAWIRTELSLASPCTLGPGSPAKTISQAPD